MSCIKQPVMNNNILYHHHRHCLSLDEERLMQKRWLDQSRSADCETAESASINFERLTARPSSWRANMNDTKTTMNAKPIHWCWGHHFTMYEYNTGKNMISSNPLVFLLFSFENGRIVVILKGWMRQTCATTLDLLQPLLYSFLCNHLARLAR